MCQTRETDTLWVKKVDFGAFIATVLYCMAQITKKLDIIVAAAEKYLVLQEFTAEDIQGVLAMEDVPHFCVFLLVVCMDISPNPRMFPFLGSFCFHPAH